MCAFTTHFISSDSLHNFVNNMILKPDKDKFELDICPTIFQGPLDLFYIEPFPSSIRPWWITIY